MVEIARTGFFREIWLEKRRVVQILVGDLLVFCLVILPGVALVHYVVLKMPLTDARKERIDTIHYWVSVTAWLYFVVILFIDLVAERFGGSDDP